MRDLAINTEPIYYKNHLGSVPVVDSYNDFTGTYAEEYSAVIKTTACVSGATGTAAMREYGKSDGFDIIARTTQKRKFEGVTSKSVFWVGFGKIDDFGSRNNYVVGDYAIYDGSIYRCIGDTSNAWDNSKWGLVPYNYICLDPKFVINSAAIYLHKVNVSEN